MGKATHTDDGLPIFSTEENTDDGLPILKKKENTPSTGAVQSSSNGASNQLSQQPLSKSVSTPSYLKSSSQLSSEEKEPLSLFKAFNGYQNGTLTGEDVAILNRHPIGKTLGTTGIQPTRYNQYASAHNIVSQKNKTDKETLDIVNGFYPSVAATKQYDPSFNPEENLNEFKKGDPKAIQVFRDKAITSLQKQLDGVNDLIQGEEMNASHSVAGSRGNDYLNNLYAQREQLTNSIEKVKNNLNEYGLSAITDKYLKQANGNYVGVDFNKIGEEYQKYFVGEQSKKQQLAQKSSSPQAEAAKQNIGYQNSQIGMNAVNQHLSNKTAEKLVKGLPTNDESLLEQSNNDIDILNGLDGMQTNLLKKYPSVGLNTASRYLGDFIYNDPELSKGFVNSKKAQAAVDKIKQQQPEVYSQYKPFFEHLIQNPVAITEGGFFAGVAKGSESLYADFANIFKSREDRAASDIARSSQANLTNVNQEYKIIYDKNGKAFREVPNENYSTFSWNNITSNIGQSLPGLAEWWAVSELTGGIASGLVGDIKAARVAQGFEKGIAPTADALKTSAAFKEWSGLASTGYINDYHKNYDYADELVKDDSTLGEFKKNVAANALTLGNIFAMKFLPLNESMQRSFQKSAGKELIELVKKRGADGLTFDELGNWWSDNALPRLQAITKAAGVNVAKSAEFSLAQVGNEQFRDFVSKTLDPKAQTSSAQDNIKTFANSFFPALMLGIPEMAKSGFKNGSTKDILYHASQFPDEYIQEVNNELKAGNIDQKRANEVITTIKTLGEAYGKSNQNTGKDGLPLISRQNRDIVINNFRAAMAKGMEETGHKIDAKAVANEVEAENKNVASQTYLTPVEETEHFKDIQRVNPELKSVSDIDPTKEYIGFSPKGREIKVDGATLLSELTQKEDLSRKPSEPLLFDINGNIATEQPKSVIDERQEKGVEQTEGGADKGRQLLAEPEAGKVGEPTGVTPKSGEAPVTKKVSGDKLDGKPIYTDYHSTIADREGKLLPFGEEIKERIDKGEPITIVTRSGAEGDVENENKILQSLGYDKKPENLTIKQGLSPEEKAAEAQKGGGVLVDNSGAVGEAAKGKADFVNANELNVEKEKSEAANIKPDERSVAGNESKPTTESIPAKEDVAKVEPTAKEPKKVTLGQTDYFTRDIDGEKVYYKKVGEEPADIITPEEYQKGIDIKEEYDGLQDSIDAIDKSIEKGELTGKRLESALKNKEKYKAEQQKLLGNEPPPTEPPAKEPEQVKEPAEEWTAVRKEKLLEIKGAKELFERETGQTWTSIQEEAMNDLQAMYPDKNLYDASRERVNEFAQQYDKNISFNPTAKDISVIRFFKTETERRMNEIEGWNSADAMVRDNAMAKYEMYNQDLLNSAKALNPREAGTAFGMRQSEARLDPKYGLKIRRMEWAKAKGEPLSEAELEQSANIWAKEKEIMQKEQQLREKGMQEAFDKEIEKLNKEWESKLKKSEKEPSTQKAKREKLLSQSGKELADKIRSGKLKGGTYATIPGFPQAVNLVIEAVAQIVEKGATLAEAISQYAKTHNIKEEAFKNDFLRVLENSDKREESLSKIKEIAQADKANTITEKMVTSNFIRDYVNSHIGHAEPKDILDVSYNELKKELPDLKKDKFIEAYLKQGDYKQPTSDRLNSGVKESENKLSRLAKLEKDINDLKESKNLYKAGTSQERTVDNDIAKKEQEVKKIMNDAGIKIANEDRYTKASYEQRAKSHNDRIDNVISKIENEIAKPDITKEQADALAKLKGQLGSAKIKLDPNSKLSQKNVVDNGLNIINSIGKEVDKTAALSDYQRPIERISEGFEKDKEESEQDIKLQRVKDKYKRDIEEYKRKLAAGEFEESEPVTLKKTDVELIKLEKERRAVQGLYDLKKEEFEKANKSGRRRLAEFARAAYVAWLIGSPKTLLKVGGSALIRPNAEAITKLTFGKIFSAIAPTIASQAKLGGESSSAASVGKLYEAYLKQYGEKGLEKLYTEANDKLSKSDAEYQNFKAKVNIMDKRTSEYKDAEIKLQKLKDKRDKDLIAATGNYIYQFIAGSSIKEAGEVLLHRTATIENMFGEFDREAWTKYKDSPNKFQTTIDNMNYIFNIVGRSHAALKNFSSRASFAAGFIARLEGAVENGIDITNPNKIIEIANESHLDWDRGKYQQANIISDGWNKAVNAVDKISPVAAYIMRTDVAVTRVPVNILHEAIVEYTAGAFTSTIKAAREYYKAKGIVLKDGYTPKDGDVFKEKLREEIKKLDPEKAAAIARAFRKGGFGLGIYALAAIGGMQFGGFHHKGQTAEDKKKAKIEEETGTKQIKTGEVKFGDYELPEWASATLEHSSALYPAFLGASLRQVYLNNAEQGKSDATSVANDALQHVNTILNSIPQIQKVLYPMASEAVRSIAPKIGEWDDIDQNGVPIKRKAFEFQDYLNILPGWGDKKEVLSEAYYKQALSIKRGYESEITRVMNDGNLSDAEKSRQRKDLLEQEQAQIDDIYKQNKENPQ